MVNQTSPNTTGLVPWKHYLTLTIESLLGFYIATFSLALYFLHQGLEWIFGAFIMVLLYLFVIIVSAFRVIRNLPIAALMLIVPLAPLIALFLVVSLIPVLEHI